MRITVQDNLGIEQDTISKLTRAKRAGGMAQAVDFLPSKWEVMSSKPSTQK
jgi:hypothetical protein